VATSVDSGSAGGGRAAGETRAKLANTLSASNSLHKTYAPVVLASVRDADAARKRGQAKLREQKPTESVTAPAGKYHNTVQKKA